MVYYPEYFNHWNCIKQFWIYKGTHWETLLCDEVVYLLVQCWSSTTSAFDFRTNCFLCGFFFIIYRCDKFSPKFLTKVKLCGHTQKTRWWIEKTRSRLYRFCHCITRTNCIVPSYMQRDLLHKKRYSPKILWVYEETKDSWSCFRPAKYGDFLPSISIKVFKKMAIFNY